MDVTLYCYGSGELIRQFLNSVAMLMKPEGSFGRYLEIAFALAAFMGAIQYTQTRRLSVLVFAILRYTIISSILLLPTFKVQIVDEVYLDQNHVVQHVPLGLALPASLSSRFFHGLTHLVETAFHMPDDLNYSKNGFLFASSLMQKSVGLTMVSSQDRQNMKNYVEQCVFYDVLHEKYSFSDLLKSEDIWALVTEKASPIRSFLMDNKIVTCCEGSSLLEEKWDTILTESGVKYAKLIFPGLRKQSNEQLKLAFTGALETSYEHLTTLSETSTGIMKQLIMVNAIRDGAMNNSTLAALSYAQSKGDFQKFLGSINTGLLAARWLPIFKDVLECMLYASFILVVMYALFSGGYHVFIHYFVSLAYLGSWPVVYAFLNYGASYTLRLTSSGYTLSMADLPYLEATNYYLSSIFGYITLTVPYFAWQLIHLAKQGLGSTFTQLSQLVGGATQSVGMGTAQELATGSFALGNIQFDNQSVSNVSGYKYDHNLSYANGVMAVSTPSGAVISQFQDGHSSITQTPALSSLNTQIHLANSLRTSAGEQADSAYQAALNDGVSYAQNMDTALRSLLDYGKSVGVSESSGDTHSITHSAGSTDSLQGVMQDVSRFAESNNVSIEEAQKHLLGAYLNANAHASFSSDKTKLGKGLQKFFGFSMGVNGTGGLKSEWDWVSSNNDSILFSKAEEFVKNENFSENLESSLRAFSEGAYRTNTEEGKRLADSVNTSYGEAQNRSDSMNANLQRSQSYRAYANYSEDNAATIDRNATQDFAEWLSQQSLQPGLGAMGYQQAEILLRENPELAEKYSQEFVKEMTSKKIEEWKKENIKGDNIDEVYNKYEKQIPGVKFDEKYNNITQQIIDKASGEGVSAGSVDKNREREAEEIMYNLKNEIFSGQDKALSVKNHRENDIDTMQEKHGRKTEEKR